jgi:integrase
MSADAVRIDLVRRIVDEFHVRPSALLNPSRVPTIAEYLPRVRAAATPTTLKTYGPAWCRAAEFFAARAVDDLMPSDILAFHQNVINAARRHPTNKGGRCAGETALRAMRRLFRLAILDGFVCRDNDPAAAVALPRRLPSTRRALSRTEIANINQVVLSGGRDTELDTLLIRLHLETACRRGGALALRMADLDLETCAVLLREKGGTLRWQPITPQLAAALHEQARCRGARRPTDALLRYGDGRPLTARHYDTLWARIRRALPWAATSGVSTHWLRHTTITWVERRYGYGIARAYAGHTDRKGASTTTYIRGRLREVATALSELTGKPHPLALPTDSDPMRSPREAALAACSPTGRL